MNIGSRFYRPARMVAVVLLSLSLGTGGRALAKSVEAVAQDVRARVQNNLAPRTPGIEVALGQDGNLILSEGFGFADIEARKPVTPQTLFRIGSVSKPLTAAGLMLLVESGRLDLDADIHKYLPDFPNPGQTITTRQLAGHLAGIRHYRGNEFLMNRHFDTVAASLKIFENDPLLFKPGEKFSYSSYGWNIISAEMESVSGQPFLSYMQTAVFEPLKLKHTLPDEGQGENPGLARFYKTKPGGGFERAPVVDNSSKWAAGGFLSTAEDLVRFGSALLHPGFLKRQSLAALFKSQKTNDGRATGYGIGWFVRQDRHGHRVLMHTGGAVGGTSVLLLYPDAGIVLALTSNCSTAPFDKTNLDAITAEFSGLVSGE